MKTFSCLYRSYATDICILFFFIHRDTSQCILTFLNEWMLDYFGEGNGTPLQYSCLKNPMGGGAWKAAVNGVAEGRTWLNEFTFTFHFHAWRRKWQPTPVFLLGESQGWGILVGCRLWGHTESDTTEVTQQQQQQLEYLKQIENYFS